MIVNRVLFLFLMTILFQCSLLDDYSDEQRGCNSHDLAIIISCDGYMQRTLEGKQPNDDETQSCIFPFFLKYKCKKKLKENSIP